jgi:hypothetical protein
VFLDFFTASQKTFAHQQAFGLTIILGKITEIQTMSQSQSVLHKWVHQNP